MPHDFAPSLPDQAPVDLTAAELAELGALLEAPPAGLTPMPLPALDGFLCGLIVQPVGPGEPDWLPRILGGGAAAPADHEDWRRRARILVLRRYAALNRTLVEDGWFEPLVFDFDDEHPIAVSEYEPLAALPPVSQAIAPWAAGFVEALESFPALRELGDPQLDALVAQVTRHLQAPDGADAPGAQYDPADPLAGLDQAIDDLVLAVAEIADLTREHRYRVETVRRELPKVGRNEPCPCGSGRKFKLCHGAR